MAEPILVLDESVEYLDFTVSNSAGVTLGAQPVAVSLDAGVTWTVAAWSGTAGATNTVSVLLGGAGVPMPAPGRREAWIKITANPEIPVVVAGEVYVRA